MCDVLAASLFVAAVISFAIGMPASILFCLTVIVVLSSSATIFSSAAAILIIFVAIFSVLNVIANAAKGMNYKKMYNHLHNDLDNSKKKETGAVIPPKISCS